MKSRPTADLLPALFSVPGGVVVTFLLFSLIPLLISTRGIEQLRQTAFVVELEAPPPPVPAEPPRPAVVRPVKPPSAPPRQEVPPPRAVVPERPPLEPAVERPALQVAPDPGAGESDIVVPAVSAGTPVLTDSAATEEPAPGVHMESAATPPAAESLPERSEPRPVPFFKLTDPPRFLHREPPLYPQEMQVIGRTGSVKVEALIDEQGAVVRVTVLRTAGEAFDRAAIAAVLASRFAPGKVNGTPVSVLYRTEVHFRLK